MLSFLFLSTHEHGRRKGRFSVGPFACPLSAPLHTPHTHSTQHEATQPRTQAAHTHTAPRRNRHSKSGCTCAFGWRGCERVHGAQMAAPLGRDGAVAAAQRWRRQTTPVECNTSQATCHAPCACSKSSWCCDALHDDAALHPRCNRQVALPPHHAAIWKAGTSEAETRQEEDS